MRVHLCDCDGCVTGLKCPITNLIFNEFSRPLNPVINRYHTASSGLFLLLFQKEQPGTLPSVETLKRLKPSFAQRYRHIPGIIRVMSVVLIIVALARPQSGNEQTKVLTEGIDIVLTVDVSGSMLAEDFEIGGKRYNRLYVIKQVVKDFIQRRNNDRIGLVVFAGMPYTQCPMTLDYGMLLQLLERIDIGMVEDGTAIGSAIASSVDRLRNTKAKKQGDYPTDGWKKQRRGNRPLYFR